MNEQVGVAANRRGEVGVGFRGQSEVEVDLGRVEGLAQGAQQQHLPALGLPRLLEPREKAGDRFRAVLLAGPHRMSESLRPGGHPLPLLPGRRGMHAVDALESEVEQVLGDRFVGGDHQVLDDLVSRERGAGHDIGRIAPLVEQDLRLRDLEVEGALLEAPAAQQPRGLDAIPDDCGYRLGRASGAPSICSCTWV